MTIEYVLLVALFAYFLMGALASTPIKTYGDYGPRLGARVERQLMTGDGFVTQKKAIKWEE